MNFQYIDGATPLDKDEIEDLIPGHLKYQNQLNEWESKNIINAEQWLFQSNLTLEKILSIDFILSLHEKMFDKTWKWAGTFRKSGKNIGVMSHDIQPELQKLIDDVKYQIENKTYSLDEICLRLHHRLVYIHCFANGNGRHARSYTDILIKSLGLNPFSWGRVNLTEMSDTRREYINALKKADEGDYNFLKKFVRS